MRIRVALTAALLVGATSLAAQPTSGPPSGVIPHLAAGGPWQTEITVVNTSSSPTIIYVLFWDDDGNPLNLPIAGIGPTTGVQFNLPANGSGILETNGSGPSALSGWASLYSDSTIDATEVFRNTTPGRDEFEASVPLVKYQQFHFVLPFDETLGYHTGVALANPAGTNASAGDTGSAQVFMTFRDQAGNILLSAGLVLPPKNHMAFLLADKYPVIAGKRGTVEFEQINWNIDGNGELSALGLRSNPTGPFTSVQPMLIGVSCVAPSQ